MPEQLSTEQAFGLSIGTSAISAWSGYNTSKHAGAMADINWMHKQGMAKENLKLNQFIQARNKIALLDASSDKSLQIQVQEMEARASAMASQSAIGMSGGSAQQVLHDIARKAEQAQAVREVELDTALFSNNMKSAEANMQALDSTGLQPIDATSMALHVGGFAADVTKSFGSLYSPINERSNRRD